MGEIDHQASIQKDLSINNFNSVEPMNRQNSNNQSIDGLTDFRRMQLQKEAAEERKLRIKRRKRSER